MRFFEFIKSVFGNCDDVIFKNHGCLCCRKEIVDGTKFSLCNKCLLNIHKISGKFCEICGDEILEGNKICDRCKETKYCFDKNRSFSVYGDVSAKIVKRFKYGKKKYYAKFIAEMMFENKDYFKDIDYLTFVSVGLKRMRERGFNQAEEIANELSKLSGIANIEFLKKVGNEKHQAGLSQKQRQENLSGTIVLNKEKESELKGKNILIIDDVFTTGATLSECARVIKASKQDKPHSVSCYTFAKTELNSTKISQNQQKYHKD